MASIIGIDTLLDASLLLSSSVIGQPGLIEEPSHQCSIDLFPNAVVRAVNDRYIILLPSFFSQQNQG